MTIIMIILLIFMIISIVLSNIIMIIHIVIVCVFIVLQGSKGWDAARWGKPKYVPSMRDPSS